MNEPLTHIDLDNIGERFADGTWTPQDVAALFVEIQRLNERVADLEKLELPAGTVLRFPLGDGNYGLVVRNSFGWEATGIGSTLTWQEVLDFEDLELVTL